MMHFLDTEGARALEVNHPPTHPSLSHTHLSKDKDEKTSHIIICEFELGVLYISMIKSNLCFVPIHVKYMISNVIIESDHSTKVGGDIKILSL